MVPNLQDLYGIGKLQYAKWLHVDVYIVITSRLSALIDMQINTAINSLSRMKQHQRADFTIIELYKRILEHTHLINCTDLRKEVGRYMYRGLISEHTLDFSKTWRLDRGESDVRQRYIEIRVEMLPD